MIAAETATNSMSAVKTTRPPKRSVSMPAGILAREPNSTGTTTSSAACAPDNPKVCLKRGPNAPIKPHIAKQRVNESVLRVKGFVDVGGKPMRLLVQAVGPRVSHYYDRAWAPGDSRRSQIVVIGLKGLDRGAVEKILAG